MSTEEPDPYARLFRDEPPAEAPQQISIQEIIELDVIEDPPAPPEVHVPDSGTGRLFRSVGAAAIPEAIPALTSSQAGRLRTVGHGDVEVVRVETVGSDAGPTPATPQAPAEYAPRETPAPPRREGRITAIGVYAGVIGLTTLVAIAQVLIFGGQPGWMAGATLVIVSIAAALGVRRSDDATAIIAPPLAFLVVALTAGQISGVGETLTSRAVAAFFVLGNNWMWIVGATLAALVIIALRRRRSG